MENAQVENAVVATINNSNVELATSISLQNAFVPIFEKAQEWAEEAKQIVVNDPTQLTEMKRARELRLKLREVRIQADKKRKELKEDSLRYGKAVQGVYNVIEFFIVPLEEELEKKEKYAETIEKERQQKLRDERSEIISEYLQYLPPCGDLGIMQEFEFQRLLDIGKEQKKKADDAAKAEQEAKEAAARKEAEEREAMRKENERLQEEARKAREAQEKAEAERREVEEKARKEREEADRKAREELKKVEEEKRRIEESARIERERVEKEEKERIAKEEKEKQDALDLARREAAAPDVEKLMTLALKIDGFQLPEVSSDEALKIISEVKVLLLKVSSHIRTKATSI